MLYNRIFDLKIINLLFKFDHLIQMYSRSKLSKIPAKIRIKRNFKELMNRSAPF